MTSASLCHLITACALAWFSDVTVVSGQSTSLNVQDLLQSSGVAVHDLSPQRTPILKVTSTATGAGYVASKTQTCGTACFSFSSTSLDKAPQTIITSTSALPTKEAKKTQSARQSTQIYQQLSSDGDITSLFSSLSSTYLIDVVGTTTFVSPEVHGSYSRTPELQTILFNALTSSTSTTLTSSAFKVSTSSTILIKKSDLTSCSFVSDLSISAVGGSSSLQLEMWSVKPENPIPPSKDIMMTSAVKMDPTLSSKYVSLSPASQTEPPTRSSTQTWARKPTHAGGYGESNDLQIFGGMTPGAKVAIGILITLCILGVVVAGVVAYRRFCVAHTSLKSFLTSGVQYKTYNNVSYKDDELHFIVHDDTSGIAEAARMTLRTMSHCLGDSLLDHRVYS